MHCQAIQLSELRVTVRQLGLCDLECLKDAKGPYTRADLTMLYCQ